MQSYSKKVRMQKHKIYEITPENRWRYAHTHEENWCGNFGMKGQAQERTLYQLDSFEREFTKDVKIKKGCRIFKVRTDRTRQIGQWYFVSLDIVKGLVYFNTQNDPDREDVIFETVGTRVDFINILQSIINSVKYSTI